MTLARIKLEYTRQDPRRHRQRQLPVLPGRHRSVRGSSWHGVPRAILYSRREPTNMDVTRDWRRETGRARDRRSACRIHHVHRQGGRSSSEAGRSTPSAPALRPRHVYDVRLRRRKQAGRSEPGRGQSFSLWAPWAWRKTAHVIIDCAAAGHCGLARNRTSLRQKGGDEM